MNLLRLVTRNKTITSSDRRSSRIPFSAECLFFYRHFETIYRVHPQGSSSTRTTVFLVSSSFHVFSFFLPPFHRVSSSSFLPFLYFIIFFFFFLSFIHSFFLVLYNSLSKEGHMPTANAGHWLITSNP